MYALHLSDARGIAIPQDATSAYCLIETTGFPTIHAYGQNLPSVWEKAVRAAWLGGAPQPTEYDAPADPNSRDVMATLTVFDPLSEPRIHRGIPGGITELVTYVEEVVAGIHDSWIDLDDPQKWWYCVGPETPVLMSDGKQKPIRDCAVGDNVVVFNPAGNKYETGAIKQVVESRDVEAVSLRIGGKSERLVASLTHPLLTRERGWVKAGDLSLGDEVAVSWVDGVELSPPTAPIGHSLQWVRDEIEKLEGFNTDRTTGELSAQGLLPLRLSDHKGALVCWLLGYLFGDGWLETPKKKSTSQFLSGKVGFSGDVSTLETIRRALRTLGFSCGETRIIQQKANLRGSDVAGASPSMVCCHSALWVLFRALGAPVGDKSTVEYEVPEWLTDAPIEAKRAFLLGFVDAEASAPWKAAERSGAGARIEFRQSKRAELENNLAIFMSQMKDLMEQCGVRDITEGSWLEDCASVSHVIKVLSAGGVDSWLTELPFTACQTKMERADIYTAYVEQGADIPWGEWEAERRRMWKVLFRPVIEITACREPVLYDIAVDHKDHNFIGGGIVCHNSYHQRLFDYPMPDGSKVNQVEYALNKLVEAPHTRRAQMITWQPWFDTTYGHCPCLQRMWFRVFEDKLLMNVHIRSNDAFKAGFMNAYAFIEFQKWMAGELSNRLGREIGVGQYTHHADSFHIYGSYFEDFKKFLELSDSRTWENRTYRSDDEAVKAEMDMAYAMMRSRGELPA